MATAESKVVLHRSAGTAGASHSAPDRCAAASSGASPAIPGNRRSPRVTASSAARQSPAGVPDGTAGRAASWPDTAGSRPASRSRNTAAREVNRDRHDRAVDAGTLRRAPPPGTAVNGRAGTRPAVAACAASTSTAWITAAPYRRRDHRSAGSSTCVRPHQRHRERRGRNACQPPGIATRRRRACPHGPSTPPHGQRSTPASSRDSTLPAEPRTVTTRCHLRHHQAAFPVVTAKR
jgi:hypothetical protein